MNNPQNSNYSGNQQTSPNNNYQTDPNLNTQAYSGQPTQAYGPVPVVAPTQPTQINPGVAQPATSYQPQYSQAPSTPAYPTSTNNPAAQTSGYSHEVVNLAPDSQFNNPTGEGYNNLQFQQTSDLNTQYQAQSFATQTNPAASTAPATPGNYQPAQYPTGQEPFNPATATNNTPSEVYSTQPGPEYQESKTGNRKLMVIGIFAVIILLIASAVLFYINYTNANKQKEENNQEQTQQEASNNTVDTGVPVNNSINETSELIKTGGEDTPASKSRKFNATELTTAWLTSSFDRDTVDAQGKCLKLEICSPTSDPDNDSVINLNEFNYELDPLNPDTDSDDISDGNELYIYYTDPTVKDSDLDDTDDLAEILACTDPIIEELETKISDERLQQIEKSVRTITLSQDLINIFQEEGGQTSDQNKGYLQTVCDEFGQTEDQSTETTTDQEADTEETTLDQESSQTTDQI